MSIMAALGLVTALISSLPSPLPDIRLSDPDILINARAVPLHAGIAFGAMIAGVLWLWINRDPAKCFLAIMMTLAGWLAAVNTANDVINTIQGSALFGTMEGAKVYREMVGWMTGGCSPAPSARGSPPLARDRRHRYQAARGVDADRALGAIAGLLLYSAAFLDTIVILFVPWQAAVATAIAYGLTARNGFRA